MMMMNPRAVSVQSAADDGIIRAIDKRAEGILITLILFLTKFKSIELG
jgi:hypothetical protein